MTRPTLAFAVRQTVDRFLVDRRQVGLCVCGLSAEEKLAAYTFARSRARWLSTPSVWS